jgi:hypothetical protein
VEVEGFLDDEACLACTRFCDGAFMLATTFADEGLWLSKPLVEYFYVKFRGVAHEQGEERSSVKMYPFFLNAT